MLKKPNFAVVVFLSLLSFTWLPSPSAAQSDTSPLAQLGPYGVGMQRMEITDETRDDRVLKATIWYPALVTEGAPRPYPPDTSGAPYPLILMSTGFGGNPTDDASLYINHLVSHGFVVAGVNHQDHFMFDTEHIAQNLIHRPLDVLFLLDHLAGLTDDPLVGTMATENVGVIGLSFGGYTTLAVSGARLDLRHFSDWCATSPEEGVLTFCSWLEEWDILVNYDPASDTDDGLLPVMTDERIRAILPIIPCWGQLFGERGLATVAAPALVIGTTADEYCPYETDTAYFFDHLGSPDRYLVTIEGRSHTGALGQRDAIRHYATAFFGRYLQEKSEYAQYLAPESADAFRNVTLEANIEAE